MTTVANLIQNITQRMHSFTVVREQVTYLTTPVDADDTTLQVANGQRVARGLIEIDEELMLVDAVEGNEVRLFPFGRAQENSSAASHLVEAKVINDPLFPTVDVLRTIQDTVHQVCPELFQVKSTEIQYSSAQLTYPLPADVDRVLQITGDVPGATGMWPKLTHWRFERSASPTEYATGKSLDLYESMTPGFLFRVTYAAPYTVPVSTSDTLEDLGIQESVREVIELGATWRLTQYLETGRLQMQSIEQFARQEAVPPGSVTNLAKQLYAMFAQRKAEERNRLLQLNPAPMHFTR